MSPPTNSVRPSRIEVRLGTYRKWAPRAHFAKPVKCGGTRIATGNGRKAPPRRGPEMPELERGCPFRGLAGLQMLDHVREVGDLLLEVALALLEPADPLLTIRKASSPSAVAAVVMPLSAHVHLPSS